MEKIKDGAMSNCMEEKWDLVYYETEDKLRIFRVGIKCLVYEVSFEKEEDYYCTTFIRFTQDDIGKIIENSNSKVIKDIKKIIVGWLIHKVEYKPDIIPIHLAGSIPKNKINKTPEKKAKVKKYSTIPF